MIKAPRIQINRRIIQNSVLLLILIFLIVFFTIQNPRFLSSRNLFNIPRQILPVVIMGCAMTFIINSGAIDLSVGGLMGLSAISFGKFVTFGVNPWLAVVLTLLVGVAVGSISTFLIHGLKLPAIMATMATWVMSSGAAYALIRAIPITDVRMKPVFVLNTEKYFNDKVPLALFIIIGVVLIFLFLEKKTIVGKYTIAMGGNENAAKFSGINIAQMRWFIFILCGIMASFSGVWAVSRIGSADPNIGLGMEFQVIAGCILGGVSIKGGDGTITGMLIGTVLLFILINGMNMMGFNPYYQQVATGIVILIAVMINYFVGQRGKKMAAQAA